MKVFALILSLAALPAHAALVGTISNSKGRTDLYNEQGECSEGWKRAEFVEGSEKPAQGCWALGIAGDRIKIVLADGRFAIFPVGMVQPVKAL